MPEKTSSFRWQIIAAVAGVCILLSVFVFFRLHGSPGNKPATDSSKVTSSAVMPSAQKNVVAPDSSSSNERERIALEEKIRDLEAAIRDTIAKMNVARAKPTNEESLLAKEIDDTRKALDDALEKHPVIVAKHAEYEKLQKEKVAVSAKQATLVEALHKARKEKYETYNDRINDVVARMSAETSKVYGDTGGKPHSSLSLSEENRVKLKEIHDKYIIELNQIKEKRSEYLDDDDTMKGYVASNDACARDYASKEQAQANILTDIAETRLQLKYDDPAIAELNRALIEKSQKRIVMSCGKPDVKALMNKIKELKDENLLLHRKIRLLSRNNVDADKTDVRSSGLSVDGGDTPSPVPRRSGTTSPLKGEVTRGNG